MLCGDLNGKEIQKRGDTCICIADSLCCTVENNNIVKQLNSKKKKLSANHIVTHTHKRKLASS